MRIALVTVKVPRNTQHNPAAKVSGVCAAGGFCTDLTGQHHTLAVNVDWQSREEAEAFVRRKFEGSHITRIEFAEL